MDTPTPSPAPLTPLGARTPHAHPMLYRVIGVLSVIILMLVGWAAWQSLTGTPVPQNGALASPTPSGTAASGWEEFTQTEYGISFEYPPAYTLRTSPISGTDGSWIQTYFGWQAAPDETILALAAMPDPDASSDFDAGFLAVSVTEMTGEAVCADTHTGTEYGTPSGALEIGGFPFVRVEYDGAGMNHRGREHSYSGKVGGFCFRISAVLQTSGLGADEAVTHEVDAAAVFAQLESVIATVRFHR